VQCGRVNAEPGFHRAAHDPEACNCSTRALPGYHVMYLAAAFAASSQQKPRPCLREFGWEHNPSCQQSDGVAANYLIAVDSGQHALHIRDLEPSALSLQQIRNGDVLIQADAYVL
jgi:hypothetical protein